MVHKCSKKDGKYYIVCKPDAVISQCLYTQGWAQVTCPECLKVKSNKPLKPQEPPKKVGTISYPYID